MESLGTALVLIAAAIFAAMWAYQTYGPIVVWGPIVLIVGWIVVSQALKAARNAEREEESRRAAKRESDARQRAAREAELRQQTLVQQNLRRTIESSCDGAIASYSRIPTALLTAEELLDRAGQEYEEGAFSPFWQAIEGVLHKLAKVDDDFQTIGNLAIEHDRAAKAYEGAVEKFPVDVASAARLAAADKTQQRMLSIVKQAQKNFQFATIFEQRRTTQVLIAGFTTLGQAIDGLGAQLSSSLDTLTHHVRDLEQGQRERHSEMISSLNSVREQVSEMDQAQRKSLHELVLGTQNAQSAANEAATQRETIASAQAKAANEQLAMLDNLQRGRAPAEYERGPRRPPFG